MNTTKRRLLSLLLAFVMVCTLAPVGSAKNNDKTDGGITWEKSKYCKDSEGSEDDDGQRAHVPQKGTIQLMETENSCIKMKVQTYTCSNCKDTGTEEIGAVEEHTFEGATKGEPNTEEPGTHFLKCTVCGEPSDEAVACTYNKNDICKICRAENPEKSKKTTLTLSETKLSLAVRGSETLKATLDPEDEDAVISWTSSDDSVATVNKNGKVTGVGKGTATITATAKKGKETIAEDSCKVTVDNSLTITSNKSSNTFTNLNQEITLTAWLNNDEIDTDDYEITWVIENDLYFDGEGSYKRGSFTVVPLRTSSKRVSTKVTATVRGNGKTYTDTYTLYLEINGSIALTATVDSDYYLGDVSNKGSYSVEEQLERAMNNLYGYKSWDYVVFDKVTTTYGSLDNVSANSKVYADEFGSIRFVPAEKDGDAVFTFTVYADSYYGESYDGVLTISVTDTGVSGGDVIFYGSVGEDVYLNSEEFDDYWDKLYPSGMLDYVTFGSVSGGSLLDADGKTAGSRSFYVSATRNQYDLDDVHFRPNSSNASKAVTISFSFTAHGENRTGSKKTSTGKVSIIYMSKNPSDISYTVGSNNTVNLKASDFSAAYKEATGSNAPSNLTIVFQGVPSSGSLTYTDSSKRNSTEVKLTSSNIRSRKFTLSSSGTNQIGDVTYTNSGSSKDTIEYIAYTGNTAKYRGRVVLSGKTVPTDITVTYQSVNGAAASFKWADFTSKNGALSDAETIRFSAPANGALYLDGLAFAAATKDLLVTQVNSVTYKPQAGSNAQEKLTFIASDKYNKTVGSGTVVINVSGNTATTTPSAPSTPSTPSGTASASQFKDVKADAWYYADLDTLVRLGIMSGRGNGVFDPNGTMTYGEALKLVLEATGHHAEAVTGNDWAINYKNLAVQNGWISNDISLTAPIPRLATASLIARVLGLSPRTGDSPFADTADGYAAALYYTNPQIFVGNPNPQGGKPMFNSLVNNIPQTTLTRAQVCAIVCRLNTYSQGSQTSQSSQPSQSSQSSTTVTVNPSTGLPDGT